MTFFLFIEDKKWIKAHTSGDAPSPRAFHSATSIDNNLYIFGGEVWYKSINAGDTFNDLYALNSMSMRWSKIEVTSSIVPSPRCKHTATPFNSWIIIFGGHQRKGHDEMVDPTLFIFDTGTLSFLGNLHQEEKKWYQKTLLSAISGCEPLSCHQHSATLLHNSKIFVFGGSKAQFLYSERGREIKNVASNDLRIFYHLGKTCEI